MNAEFLRISIVEKFLRYAVIDTQSDRHSEARPTTPGQWDLLNLLNEELLALGISDITLTAEGFLIARIPSNLPEGVKAPVIGFMAHVDTSSETSGSGVKPQLIESYPGGDIPLADGIHTISAADNPELQRYVGHTIITTDGTTLLGADDKAGVAEIMSAAEFLLAHPEIPHGEIELIFTPDEETGMGMDRFPADLLHSGSCYTLDGGEIGDIDTECFNAGKIEVTFRGVMYHLGAARGRFINAVTMAASFISLLPQAESPEATDGRFGYYCPLEIEGNGELTSVTLLLRDFELSELERRRKAVESAAALIEELYPGGEVKTAYTQQYLNMREYLSKDPKIIGIVDQAAESLDIPTAKKIIRGGTDGARLSELGIPTPNLFTGGHNYHSRFEWAAVPAMVDAARMIIKISELWGAEKV